MDKEWDKSGDGKGMQLGLRFGGAEASEGSSLRFRGQKENMEPQGIVTQRGEEEGFEILERKRKRGCKKRGENALTCWCNAFVMEYGVKRKER